MFLSFRNPRVPCHSLPHIDLNAWRDSPEGCQIAGNSVSVGQTVSPSPCTSCICTPEGVSIQHLNKYYISLNLSFNVIFC